MLTQARLKEVLHYDPDTGVFTWLAPGKGRKKKKNGVAGCSCVGGYTAVRVDSILYRAHRLAWLYVYGEWPSDELDHRDTDPSNNRINNLRLASSQDNKRNRSIGRGNTSGLKGVGWHPQRGKWRARIMVGYREIHLGLFTSELTAHAAYVAAARKYFGEFARAS